MAKKKKDWLKVIKKHTLDRVTGEGDQNLFNKARNLGVSKNIKSGSASGSIQKDLVENKGFSRTQLRKLGDKTKAFKKNRKEMNELRKSNPEEYRKRKKKQRKAEMAKSFKAKSSTWD